MPLDPKAKLDYPLHWAVFLDEKSELEELLKQKETVEIDKQDPRGRTPLMLAVTLGRIQCAQLLLKNGANADAHNKQMWSVSNESVSLGEYKLISDVVNYRDYQRATNGARSMKNTLLKLKDVPDFFCEMNWDFSSWVPFLAQACPSDTYKVYKQGSSVRIDTTLVSFQGSNWVRGNQSFIFRVNEAGFAEFVVLDHENRTAAVQSLRDDEPFEDFKPSPDSIAMRLATPISTTYIDVDNIGFERTSRGFLSWFSGSDSTEKVDGFDCKILAASNVQLVTKKRTEHLRQADRDRIAQEESEASSKAMSSIMKMLQSERSDERTTVNLMDQGITPVEYLDPEFEFDAGTDIGRPREVSKKSNAFKATLWMANGYQLNLQEQIIPIVELMAVNSPHFARLHNFIRLQLPAGFPVKIEIPLFHVLSARINFQNVNEPGKYVTPVNVQTGFKASAVNIDQAAFEVPSTYFILSSDDSTFNITWEDENDPSMTARGREGGEATNRSNLHGHRYMPSDEMLLQLAIEQSMRESIPSSSSVSNGANGLVIDGEITDEQLARALQMQFDSVMPADPPSYTPPADTEYLKALRASQAEEEQRRREESQFEEELRKVLELSKLDN